MKGKEGLALVFLTGATFLFFWPVWVAGYYFPKGGGDLGGIWHPVWSFVARWIRQGVFPLWNPLLGGGDPLIGDPQYGLFNPLNWPLFLIHPLPYSLALLRAVLPLWLAGVGMYFYLRRSPNWQLGRDAALFGATAYMLADPFITHLGHPSFNDALAWFPWVLWGIDAAVRRPAKIPVAAFLLHLLVISGHESLLYGAAAAGLYGLWQVAEGGISRALHRLGRLALIGLLGFAFAAPTAFPVLERIPFTDRAGVPWELHRGYEFPPAMLVDFLAPSFHGRGVEQFWPFWNRVESGYIGAVALYLAFLGLLGEIRERRMWVFIILGTLAYLLAIGYRGPIYPRIDRLPLLAQAWKTARAIFVLSFALAVAAARGIEHLRWGRSPVPFIWLIALGTGAVALWLLAPSWVSIVPSGAPRLRALTGLRFASLLAIATAVLGWAASRRRPWACAGLLLLLLAELVALGALVETEPATPSGEDPHRAAVAFLKADPGWFRVEVDPSARGLWPPVFLRMEGFEVPQGVGNATELRAFNVLRWRIPSATHPAYRMLGVKYMIVPKGAPPGGPGIWPVFIDDPLVDIHLNTLALPRVWLVYRTEVVRTYGEALERVLDENFRPEEVAVVQNGPYLEGAGQGRIEMGYYGPNDVVLHVETDAPALLVLSDTFYPDWQAAVDGMKTPIYQTNAAFRGILVPSGTHRVEMHFRPRSLRVGLGLAAMGVLASLTLWLTERRCR